MRRFDSGGATSIRHQSLQRFAIEAQSAIEGGGDVAGFQRTGKDSGGGGMKRIECGVICSESLQLLFQPRCELFLHRSRLAREEMI